MLRVRVSIFSVEYVRLFSIFQSGAWIANLVLIIIAWNFSFKPQKTDTLYLPRSLLLRITKSPLPVIAIPCLNTFLSIIRKLHFTVTHYFSASNPRSYDGLLDSLSYDLYDLLLYMLRPLHSRLHEMALPSSRSGSTPLHWQPTSSTEDHDLDQIFRMVWKIWWHLYRLAWSPTCTDHLRSGHCCFIA